MQAKLANFFPTARGAFGHRPAQLPAQSCCLLRAAPAAIFSASQGQKITIHDLSGSYWPVNHSGHSDRLASPSAPGMSRRNWVASLDKVRSGLNMLFINTDESRTALIIVSSFAHIFEDGVYVFPGFRLAQLFEKTAVALVNGNADKSFVGEVQIPQRLEDIILIDGLYFHLWHLFDGRLQI